MNKSTPRGRRLGFWSRLAVSPLIFLLMCYKRHVSPLLGDRCRYVPYCSDYAMEALRSHGFWKGLYLAVTRICRCHPFCDGGVDPVPAPRDRNREP